VRRTGRGRSPLDPPYNRPHGGGVTITLRTRSTRKSRLVALVAILAATTLLASGATFADAASGHPRSDRAMSDGARQRAGRRACSAETPPTGTETFLRGVDVSHWNETIDWNQVKAAGIEFAYAKATQRVDFEDPMYATYKTDARTAHVRFGAYEYMDVMGGAKAAVKDADHFVSFAALDERNLVPVLDAEQTNGYTPAKLQKWMMAWLGEVYKKLRVRPIIYTSPSFWTTALADTTQFSQLGYPLWIAHWGVDTPTLPALDWNARGWTFWQWTDCGTVAGITGDVDLDLFQGTLLRPVVIKGARTP